MPDFFDGRAIVTLSKQPTNFRLLNRKFRTQDGLSLTARIQALLGHTIDPGHLDTSFFLDSSYLDAFNQIEAHITHVAGQTPVPVNWDTNAHRLYGGIVPIVVKTLIDRPAEIGDVYDVRTIVQDNELARIKSYATDTNNGIRYDAEEDGDNGSRLGINFRLGSSRLGG